MLRKGHILSVWVVLALVCFVPQFPGQSSSQFYAVYDWITDADQLGYGLHVSELTPDGKKIFFVNYAGNTGRKGYVCNPDGSGLTSYSIPDGSNLIGSIAVDHTGKRAFFAANYDMAIYKLENGLITRINADTKTGFFLNPIRTTADGNSVYFMDYWGDIWRAGHDGSSLVKIIDDIAVPRDGGLGADIREFAISADGSTIAFLMYGYWKDGVRIPKNELFVHKAGVFSQLTQDGHAKDRLAISGDGCTIVYDDGTAHKYFATTPSGDSFKELVASGFNFGGIALTYDGRKMFYVDAGANGGRMVDTVTAVPLDLFPAYNPIAISILNDLSITDDGSHILFRHEYSTYPFKHSLYLGHFNDRSAAAGAPAINSVTFNPAAMLRGNASARVKLLANMSDPEGLADIKRVAADEMIGGLLEFDSQKLPAYFYFGPRDDGVFPDEVAKDGIFTTEGQPGGKINDYNEMTMRIAARDASNHVAVMDVILPVSNTLNTITVTSPNGGETWAAGTTHPITWTQSGLSGNVTIELYKGAVKVSSIGSASASAGSYSWLIPLSTTPGNDYKVRIYQGSVEDYSNANFTIAKGAQFRKLDFLATWTGSGVFYRNSDTGAWISLASSAKMIAAGDVDGDGIDDLIGVWPGSMGMHVLYSSTGKWAYEELENISGPPSWIAAGDLNGDGKDDLIGIWGARTYWRNSYSGQWAAIASGAVQVAAADLDGDGKDDLIGVWPNSGVRVRYSGTGRWAEISSAADWIAVGDMTGDGKPDLVGIWGSEVWCLDLAKGTWQWLTSGATQIAAGDLDGDGTADLIGIWPASGVYVKYSSSGAWERLSSVPTWIAVGRTRS